MVESLSGNSLSTHPVIKIDGLFDNRDNYWRLVKLTLPLALFLLHLEMKEKVAKNKTKPSRKERHRYTPVGT